MLQWVYEQILKEHTFSTVMGLNTLVTATGASEVARQKGVIWDRYSYIKDNIS